MVALRPRRDTVDLEAADPAAAQAAAAGQEGARDPTPEGIVRGKWRILTREQYGSLIEIMF